MRIGDKFEIGFLELIILVGAIVAVVGLIFGEGC